MNDKKLLRADIQLKRNNIDPTVKHMWDLSINRRLFAFLSQYDVIHTYLPIKTEIDIHPTIERLLDIGKQIICPKTLLDGTLSHIRLHSLDRLQNGSFGTKHPIGDEYEGTIDVVLVPGMVFDKMGNRIGYGGGYYDRFLRNYRYSINVAACYDFQLIDSVPAEAHDVAVDYIITPELEISIK